ncbi:MAG TPA: TonB-dependent receptor [Flavobacteriaceae bacterium]|jgi:outer membrane receptor for ferrienterochelin and colicins|nr:TonB-dependent receptor [Flavobacteriaceae bacterium]
MVLNKKIFAVCFLLFSISLSFAQRQDKVIKDSVKINDLEEVIVTATRTIRQLSSLPLPAQIISKKEIQAINSLRLTDLLNEQTGLIIVRDHGEGIQMQGMDSEYTLILIDGVPLVGRTAGTLDLSRITVGNIKQIEIVKGASSSLYGSEALAGVINIITEDPKEGFSGGVGLRYGTFNTNDVNANINYKKNKFGFTAFANRFSNDGYDLDNEEFGNTVDPYTNYTFNTKVSYDFSEDTKLLVSGRVFTENQDYIPTEELKGESSVNEWNAHVKLDHKHNEKWSSYLDFYTTRYKADRFLNKVIDGTRSSESDYNQLMIRPEVRVAYNPSKKHSFIGGVGLTHETLDRTYFSIKPEYNAPYIYAQYDAALSKKINIILGARFDNHSEYESQFSPKVAVRYEFNDKIAIKGSVGYGYKAPDFRQLYLDFTNPTAGYSVIGYNQVTTRIPEFEAQGQLVNILVPLTEFEGALKPENSLSFNLGFQLKPISSIKINLNLFRNDIKDLIDTRIIARKTNGKNIYSYQNISRVYMQGLEFNTTWKPTNQLKFSAGYQFLLAKDKDAEEAFENGEVSARHSSGSGSFILEKSDYYGLRNRSRHMANAKVFYTIPQWGLDANIRATYRSKYGLRDTNGSSYIDIYDTFVKGYTIWDVAINKTIYKNFQLGVGIDNVFGFTDPQNIGNISGQLTYGKLNINF